MQVEGQVKDCCGAYKALNCIKFSRCGAVVTLKVLEGSRI